MASAVAKRKPAAASTLEPPISPISTGFYGGSGGAFSSASSTYERTRSSGHSTIPTRGCPPARRRAPVLRACTTRGTRATRPGSSAA